MKTLLTFAALSLAPSPVLAQTSPQWNAAMLEDKAREVVVPIVVQCAIVWGAILLLAVLVMAGRDAARRIVRLYRGRGLRTAEPVIVSEEPVDVPPEPHFAEEKAAV